MLHKGSQVQAHCPSPESSIQHSQFDFDVQVQLACDFEGRLPVLPPTLWVVSSGEGEPWQCWACSDPGLSGNRSDLGLLLLSAEQSPGARPAAAPAVGVTAEQGGHQQRQGDDNGQHPPDDARVDERQD